MAMLEGIRQSGGEHFPPPVGRSFQGRTEERKVTRKRIRCNFLLSGYILQYKVRC